MAVSYKVFVHNSFISNNGYFLLFIMVGKMACASDVNADYIIVPILGSSTMQNQRCVTPYWIVCTFVNGSFHQTKYFVIDDKLLV